MSTPTTEVRAGHEFSVAILEKYLLTQIPTLKTPLIVRQFSVGQSNPTFLLTAADGARYVLRKKPPGDLVAKSAHQVDREYRIIKTLRENTSLPMPDAVCYCADRSVIGTEFFVMVFCEGRVITDNMLLSVPQHERRSYWNAYIEPLAAFHKVDHQAIGLGNYGKHGGYYERQIQNLFRLSEAQAKIQDKDGVAVGPLPRFEDMKAWFKKNIVKDEVSLFHGDYKPDNCILHPSETKVKAILDWELSTVGHPLADLAHICLPFYTSDMPVAYDRRNNAVQKVIIDPPVEEVIQMYCKASGRAYPISGWKFCVAFAIFRMAVILQGIRARFFRGQASNPKAKEISERVDSCTQYALRLIDSESKL